MGWNTEFPFDKDKFAGSVAELLALRGEAREVAILALSVIDITFVTYDNWNGGTHSWNLSARIPAALYASFTSEEIHESACSVT